MGIIIIYTIIIIIMGIANILCSHSNKEVAEHHSGAFWEDYSYGWAEGTTVPHYVLSPNTLNIQFHCCFSIILVC